MTLLSLILAAHAATPAPRWTDPCPAWGPGAQDFGTVIQTWDEQYDTPRQVAFCEGSTPCPQWYPVRERTMPEFDVGPADRARTSSTLVRVTRRYQHDGIWRIAEHEGVVGIPLCAGDVVSAWWGVAVRIQRSSYGGQGFMTLEGGSSVKLGDPTTLVSGAVTLFLPTQVETAAKVCHVRWGAYGAEASACSNNTIFRVELNDPTALTADVAVAEGADVEDPRYPTEPASPDRPHTLEVRDSRGEVIVTVPAGRAERVTEGGSLPLDALGSEEGGRAAAMLGRIDGERAAVVENLARTPATVTPRAGVEESRRYRLVLEGRAVPLLVLVDGGALPRWQWVDGWEKGLRETLRGSREFPLGPGPHTIDVWSPSERRDGAPTVERVTVMGGADNVVQVPRAARRESWEVGVELGGVEYHVTYETPDGTPEGSVEGYQRLALVVGSARYRPPIGPNWWVGASGRWSGYSDGFSPTRAAVLQAGLSGAGSFHWDVGLGGGLVESPSLVASPAVDDADVDSAPEFATRGMPGVALTTSVSSGGRSTVDGRAHRLLARVEANLFAAPATANFSGWAELRPGVVYRTSFLDFEASGWLSIGSIDLSPVVRENAQTVGTGFTGGVRCAF